MIISLIVAHDINFVIGQGDTLPWNSKEDMQWFIQKTKYKAIVMGSTTALGIGKKLPNREHYVLSSDPSKIDIDGVHAFAHFEDVLSDAICKGYNELVICGGVSLYTQFLDRVQKMYITEIPIQSDGDVALDIPLIKELNDLPLHAKPHRGWVAESIEFGENEGCCFSTFVKVQNPIN